MRPDRCLLWLLMFALPVAIGCDAAKQAATAVKGGVETGISKAKELASEAGASMSNAATKATAAVDTDGAMTLSLGETLQLEQCFAHFAASVGERSAILQLRSYETRASGEAACCTPQQADVAITAAKAKDETPCCTPDTAGKSGCC